MAKDKQEYETTLNEVLGANIKWSKLNKDDLVSIANLLANPSLLCEKLGGKFLKNTEQEPRVVELLQKRFPLISEALNIPLLRVLKE